MDFNQYQNDFTKNCRYNFSDTNTVAITIRVQEPYGIDFQNPTVKMVYEGDTDEELSKNEQYTDSIQTGSEGTMAIVEGLNFLGSGLEQIQIGNVFFARWINYVYYRTIMMITRL